jgi:S-(hydroxymethyl)glutathione dehydrogenase / alcohol dehydrogenase
MQAMVYRGPCRIRVETKPMPEIEHPNDAIVRVTCAAICGSDLHLYHGLIPDTRVGMTFGHEFVGIVEQVGSSVQSGQAARRREAPLDRRGSFRGALYPDGGRAALGESQNQGEISASIDSP